MVQVIVDEKVLNSYAQKLVENGMEVTVAVGDSMMPVIEHLDILGLTPVTPRDMMYGGIYAFYEGDRLIIKRLMNRIEMHMDGQRGHNYIFEGDNRAVSVDKKVFVPITNYRNTDTFKKVHVHPFADKEKRSITEDLLTKLKAGLCMTEEFKDPKLSADTLKQIEGNQELINFLQDLKAIAHNASLRVFEMSCLTDGMLNFMRDKDMCTTDEMWNYINISTNIKEWHIHTGEVLTFSQFFKKFYPELTREDLKTEKHKIDMPKLIDDYKKAEKKTAKTKPTDKNLN